MRPDGKPGPAVASRPRRRLLRAAALGLWFCALALLGLVRAWLAASDEDGSDAVAALWLWGSLGLLAIGGLALARALRRPR
jgi:hypothetical protein